MQRLGFIRDMMDVKILVLFVAARAEFPMTAQEVYELCYQDECLSYFDICTALPEMVETGHMEQIEDGRYQITEKGRADGKTTEDSIAFTVKQSAENAISRFNRQLRRRSFVKTQIRPEENGSFSVVMALSDEVGSVMTLELTAPDQRQAIRLSRLMEERAEDVYKLTMTILLEDDEEEED